MMGSDQRKEPDQPDHAVAVGDEEPRAAKRRGRPFLPADQLRTGRLQRRVFPDVEALAKQLSTEAIEEAIRAAARAAGIDPPGPP